MIESKNVNDGKAMFCKMVPIVQNGKYMLDHLTVHIKKMYLLIMYLIYM